MGEILKARVEALKQKALDKDLVLHLDESVFIDEDHLSCLWYGGNLATIETDRPGYTLTIDVIGDVEATLYDDNDDDINWTKDHNNAGRFYDDFKYYIKSDKELYELIQKDKLLIQYNNWVEVDCYYDDGKDSRFIDWGMVCDNIMGEENVLNAIEEVIDRYNPEIESWIDWETEK